MVHGFGSDKSALVVMTRSPRMEIYQALCDVGFRARLLADTFHIEDQLREVPNFVVIDTTLRPMLPAAFVQLLRKSPRPWDIPVIVITTSCDDIEPLEELHTQVTEVYFMNLPIVRERFLALAESLLTPVKH